MLIACGLALVTFVYLSARAAAGDSSARRWALSEAFILGVFAPFALPVALYFALFECDEACDPESDDWWHRPDAWQWDAQLLVAVAGVATMIAVFFLTHRRRYRQAIASAVGAAACFGAWAAFMAPFGI